jgi:hypothetical protein
LTLRCFRTWIHGSPESSTAKVEHGAGRQCRHGMTIRPPSKWSTARQLSPRPLETVCPSVTKLSDFQPLSVVDYARRDATEGGIYE